MMYRLQRTNVYRHWEVRIRDTTAVAVLTERLARLTAGQFGDCRSVGDGVLELRIHIRRGYRVYFMVRDTDIVLLLCGGVKDSQVRDIATAKRLKKDIEH